jgi:hypothetical protein
MSTRCRSLFPSVLFLSILLPMALWAQKFAPPVPYSTGAPAPNGVALGDLNGDGRLDVVVANAGLSGTVAVLLGNADGTLQPAVTYPARSYPEFVLLGDFNRDGHLDVAVGNRAIGGSGWVSILLGNGDGTLRAPVSYGPFTDAFSLATGDFNSDGVLDIAVADVSSGSLLLGNGDGTFRTGKPIGASNAVFFAVADFNHDGKLDLVSANNSGKAIQLFIGNGRGTFKLESTGIVATPPIALVAADLNGDGIPDIASADEAVNNVGSNVGVFESSPQGYVRTKYPYGDEPRLILAADINQDGKLDLVTENEFNGTVDIFINQGKGVFATPIVLYDGAITAASVAVGDLNGDGKPDIVVTDGQIPGQVHVLLQE